MSKKLIIVRHAKSDWSVQGQKDFDRTLNERGFRDAPRMGHRLAERGLPISMLVSSPATRARLTAEYFAEQLKMDLEQIQYLDDIYDASVRVLMNVIVEFKPEWNCVVLFGHNPGLSYFVEYVTGQVVGELTTCAVVALEFTVDEWAAVSKDTAKILFHDYPKLYEPNLEA